MSTIAEETKQAVHAAGRTTAAPQRRRIATPESTSSPVRFIADDRASRTTALVFQAILFCAMCVSLVAVIQQATTDASASAVAGTGVDDAPPAVFVNAD